MASNTDKLYRIGYSRMTRRRFDMGRPTQKDIIETLIKLRCLQNGTEAANVRIKPAPKEEKKNAG